MMNDQGRLRWLVLAVMALGGAVLASASGLSVRWEEMPAQAAVLSCIGLGAAYFRARGRQRFVTILVGMLQLLAFTICYTVAMYAACSLNRPLVDDWLAACDAALGFHLPVVVGWTQRHPWTGTLLGVAYYSMLPQTLLVIGILGGQGLDRELHRFLSAFFLSLLLALVAFAFWPAAGPFAQYGIEPSGAQGRYLEHFYAFRSGARTVISWRAAEGLITFPSFHTAAAVLLACALRTRRCLFVPGVVLNLAVIASTMTTGWHYLVDVLAGCALAAVSVGSCRACEMWHQRRPGAALRSWWARSWCALSRRRTVSEPGIPCRSLRESKPC